VFPWRVLLLGASICALIGVAVASLGARGSRGSSAPAPAPLASLPLAAQGPVSAAVGGGQRAFAVRGLGDGFLAENAGQELSASFTRSGMTVRSHGLRLALGLRAIGYGGSLRALGAVAPTASANRVTYERAGVSEWYANGPLGIEQGFTLARAPASPSRAAGRLTLGMALSSNATSTLSADGQRLELSAGASRLSYDGLVVSDAAGRRLPSRLSLTAGELRIGIDARGARYPLRVDPFVQQAKLTAKEQNGGSNLGQSVAISADGSTALVGGPSDEEPGKSEMLVGAAWVFTRTGSSWIQQGPKLRGSDREGEGQFGISVALSADGNTALIGGINDANAGAAWVFTRAGGKWTQQGGKLTGGIEESGSGRFGKSVALSSDGNTALVGAYFDASSTGSAWAFKRSGTTWSHYGKKLTGSGEEGPGQFGLSVALSADGKTALIGGPADEGSSKEAMAGAAWAFTDSGAGYSAQGPKLTAGAAKGAGELGTSVALSADGSTALVGAPGDGAAGGARAFQRSGATWSPQGAELKPSDAVGPAGFGTAVTLSGDGATALIGGPVDEDGPNGGTGPLPSGAAWHFTRSGTAWSQQGTKIVGTTSESEFGAAVALTPDTQTALIGGPIDSTGTVPDAGAFWVYVNPLPQPEALPPPAALTPPGQTPLAPSSPRPILANVSQSHARWRAGGARARLSTRDGGSAAGAAKSSPKAKVRRPPLGTTFSFTLNTAASVKLTFTRKVAGRRVKGKCRPRTASNKSKPVCRRTVVALAFSVSAKAGARKLSFQGSAAGKKLSPGAYTVTLVASNAGLSSTPKSLSFTIVR
jgi:hypothetical protein